MGTIIAILLLLSAAYCGYGWAVTLRSGLHMGVLQDTRHPQYALVQGLLVAFGLCGIIALGFAGLILALS